MANNDFIVDAVKGKPSSLTSIAFSTGVTLERQRILKRLTSYFELTRFSVETEGAPENPEWESGYQAAMAIAKGYDK